MSIELLGAGNDHLMSIWLIWTGAAILPAWFMLARRSRQLLTPRVEPAGIVVVLGPAAVLMYAVFIGAAIVTLRVGDKAGMSPDSPELKAMLAIMSPLGGVLVGSLIVSSHELRHAIGLPITRLPRGIVWGLIGITIVLPLVWWSLQATNAIWSWLGVTHPEKHDLLLVLDRQPAWWVKTTITLAAVGVTPVFEEMLFRGLIQTAFRRISARAWLGILIASVLFAGVHAGWTSPSIFVLSVAIGVVYELSGSLWAAIVMHAAFNAFAICTSGL